MREAPRPYFSYLLRLWRAEVDGQEVWRGSLENPQTGQVKGFDNPESLFSYLTLVMGEHIDSQTDVKNTPLSTV